MKIIFIIIIFAVLESGQVQGLSFGDEACYNYLLKLGFSDNENGQYLSKIAFTGDVSFITGTTNAKVDLRYSDVDLFNDEKYFGLVKEDGKTEDTVCLDLKLWQFKSDAYDDPVQVTDLPITPSSNSSKKWRYYSFTIPANEFQTRLVQTSNSNQFIYNGFYCISFYAVGTEDEQYTFYFEFTLVIDKKTGAAIDKGFKPWQESPFESCCGLTPYTLINFCTDLTCTSSASQDLHVNDQFILKQKTKMDNYYLTETKVWFSGIGLYKTATPISVNNTIPGQVIIQLKAEIAWYAVKIIVISTLSTTQTGGRRMLVQTEYEPFIGETQEKECIKPEGSDSCATCEQECDINGFAHEGCEDCSLYKQIIFFFLPFFLISII